MADIIVDVVTPATSYALVTLEELKAMLNIPATDTSEDAMLQLWIDQYSDVIATMCNRVFGKETVTEIWTGDLEPFDSPRLFLTRYPVKAADIISVESPEGLAMDPAGYNLDSKCGKLKVRAGYAWSEPIVVSYTGGYDLPTEAPPALKAALGLAVSTARIRQHQAVVSGVRSISHRESRVMFFDVNATAAKLGTTNPVGSLPAALGPLLYHYTRIYV